MNRAALLFLLFCMPLSISGETAFAEDISTNDSAGWVERLTGFLDEGKFILNLRTRYEHADQDGLDASNAGTIRTRLGYQTVDSRAFSGLIEMENTIAIDENGYDAYPGAQGKPGHTLIADPRNLEVNRLQVSYKGDLGDLSVGRQRIILDNARFIGNVGWRQNEQTFDAITLLNRSIQHLSVFYGYLDQANRIFGENADLQAQRRFEMNTHLVNILYEGCPFGKIGGYAYLIKVGNAPANSGDTFGAYLDGSYKLSDDLKLSYRGEYAYQNDNAESPAGSSFDLDYFHLMFGASWGRLNVDAGYESLEGDGRRGFGTPLATAHMFNGWADVFLSTPEEGLEDKYLSVGVSLARNVVVKAVYHLFEAQNKNVDYGEEYDLVGIWTIDKHLQMTAKYADFQDAATGYPGVKKFWLQLVFTY